MSEVPLYGSRVSIFHVATCRFYRGERVSLGDDDEVQGYLTYLTYKKIQPPRTLP